MHCISSCNQQPITLILEDSLLLQLQELEINWNIALDI